MKSSYILLTLSLVLSPALVAQGAAKGAAAKKAGNKKGGKNQPKDAPLMTETSGDLVDGGNYGRPWKRSMLDLRVGVYGGLLMPIGQASQVLNTGFGGSLLGSIETSFIKLPKSKIFEKTLLMYEFSYYKVKGTSVSSKIGQDTDADYVTNAGAIGKAFDVDFTPKFVLRFIPYLGVGLTNITSDTQTPIGTVHAVSGDVIMKYGVITAYDFDRRFQAIFVLDHYIYFEEKIGMSLRIGLGLTMMIF